MRNKYKNIIGALGVSLICTTLSAQQTYINKEWDMSNGNPGQYDQVACDIDPNGNLVYVTNNLNNSSNTDIFLNCIHPSGNVAWQQTCPSSATQDDYGADLKIDATGNIYVTGAHHNGNNLDYFVAKYDQMGTLLWQQYYNGNANGDDVPSAIDIDANGNIYVTGTSYGGWTLTDIVTVKYDNNGNQQWIKKYNFNNKVEVATDIKVDNAGNILVLGTSANNWSNSDFVVRKYAPSGTVLATKRHNSPGNGYDLPTELTVDANNNVFVVGTSKNGSNKNIKVIAYNANLQVQWVNYIDKSGNADEGYGIVVDNNGDVIITGYCTKTNGGTDIIVRKYNPTGTQLWEYIRSAPIDTDIAKGRKVTTDSSNNIFLASEIQLNNSRDFSLISLNNNGNIRYAKDFNLPQNNSARQIIQKNETIYITGISDSASAKKATTVKVSVFDKNQPTVYCNAKPCAVDDEVLVRFNPDDLILSNVDNKDKTWGIVADFVNQTAINYIFEKTGINFSKLKCYKVHPNITSSDTVSISRLGNTVKLPPFYATFGVILPTGSNDSLVVQNLNASVPHVLIATINGYAELLLGANDPYYNNGSSAGLVASGSIPSANINIEPAWDYETGGSSIIVGVYDSGINHSHKDLSHGTFSSSSVKNGYDYFNTAPITATADPDNYGHGSAVAGIIGAWRNNSFGIAGIAGGPIGFTGVSLHDMKIFDVTTGCSVPGTPFNVILTAIVDGSQNLVMPRQDIQNHSWRQGGPANPLIREAFITAYRNEIVSCIASGNGAASPPNPCIFISYPASFKDHMVMKIGGNDSTGARASFSECGFNLDFVAPATHDLYIGLGDDGNNFSDSLTWGTGCTGILDGTSFAAPHGAGVAALMLSYANNNPLPNQFSHEDCEQLMERNSTDITSAPNLPGYDDETGWGRLNAGDIFDSIKYPDFLVKHYSFTSSTSSAILVGFQENTCLEQSLFGLPVGAIKANRWKVTSTTSHTIPSGYGLIDAWARGSGSDIYGISSGGLPNCLPLTCGNCDYFPAEPNPSLDVFSATNATMTGYIYELLDSNLNTVGWWPFDTTGTATFAYTLYLANPTVGIEEINQKFDFNLFPNPANNTFTIQIGQGFKGVTDIIITDVTGKLVVKRSINAVYGQNILLPTNSFSEGMYFVTLRNNQKQLTRKLLINH